MGNISKEKWIEEIKLGVNWGFFIFLAHMTFLYTFLSANTASTDL